MSIHPAIYSQPSEVKPGDPREPYLLVGSWSEGWTDLRKKRFEVAMDRIAPMVMKNPTTTKEQSDG